MTQPTALRLADDLIYVSKYSDSEHWNTLAETAAELRRLYDLAMELQGKIYALEMARSMEMKTAKLKRDALLEALHSISLASQDSGSTREGMGLYARAAVKKAEENT